MDLQTTPRHVIFFYNELLYPMCDTIPLEFQSLLWYDAKWQVLICRVCGLGLAADRLVRHLRSVHHMKYKEHRPIVRAISTLPAIDKADQFPCPLSPIADLPIHRGFKCDCCDKLTRGIKIIKTHVAKSHTIPRVSVLRAFHPVLLQTWLNSHRVKYWTVVDSNVSFSSIAVTEASTYGAIQSEPLMWGERMARMEAERLHNQGNGQLEFRDRHKSDDTTPWLLRTKWPELFSEKNLKLIGETRQSCMDNEYVVEGFDIKSEKLCMLAQAFDRIMGWAKETLDSTPLSLRCWLWSPTYGLSKGYKKRARKHGISIIGNSFYIIISRLAFLKQVKERVYGIRFTNEQLNIQEINLLLGLSDDDEEEYWLGHLIEGCYSPMSDITSLMAYGKYVAKQQGKNRSHYVGFGFSSASIQRHKNHNDEF